RLVRRRREDDRRCPHHAASIDYVIWDVCDAPGFQGLSMAWLGKLVVCQATYGSSLNLRQRRIVDHRAERAGRKNVDVLRVNNLWRHGRRTEVLDGLPNSLFFHIGND